MDYGMSQVHGNLLENRAEGAVRKITKRPSQGRGLEGHANKREVAAVGEIAPCRVASCFHVG
jgi:hypothetical protein